MVEDKEGVARIIKAYIRELKKNGVNPEKVILFGSYAKCRPHEGSDIDLIVISPDFEKMNFRERLEFLGIMAGRILEPVESYGYTIDEINKREKYSFLDDIYSNGIVVNF